MQSGADNPAHNPHSDPLATAGRGAAPAGRAHSSPARAARSRPVPSRTPPPRSAPHPHLAAPRRPSPGCPWRAPAASPAGSGHRPGAAARARRGRDRAAAPAAAATEHAPAAGRLLRALVQAPRGACGCNRHRDDQLGPHIHGMGVSGALRAGPGEASSAAPKGPFPVRAAKRSSGSKGWMGSRDCASLQLTELVAVPENTTAVAQLCSLRLFRCGWQLL